MARLKGCKKVRTAPEQQEQQGVGGHKAGNSSLLNNRNKTLSKFYPPSANGAMAKSASFLSPAEYFWVALRASAPAFFSIPLIQLCFHVTALWGPDLGPWKFKEVGKLNL